MAKIPTVWTTNTAIGTVDPYDTTGSYDGGGTTAPIDSYDGVKAGLSPITAKVPAVWSATGKTASQWTPTGINTVGMRAYDSSSTVYDSGSLKYDGTTATQLNGKIPTVWSTT